MLLHLVLMLHQHFSRGSRITAGGRGGPGIPLGKPRIDPAALGFRRQIHRLIPPVQFFFLQQFLQLVFHPCHLRLGRLAGIFLRGIRFDGRGIHQPTGRYPRRQRHRLQALLLLLTLFFQQLPHPIHQFQRLRVQFLLTGRYFFQFLRLGTGRRLLKRFHLPTQTLQRFPLRFQVGVKPLQLFPRLPGLQLGH
ncbi:MAG: hypothetical protein BWY71_01751 [Planctomycetes bacterium ADurb.Bin412]|nr:MAG: hypothetical protein BWY71_01751 [Planctomycetes bacterium ADurb.Bin412]